MTYILASNVAELVPFLAMVALKIPPALIIMQILANVFACRSEQTSILRLGFFSNPLIWLGIGIEWALVLVIINSAPLKQIFSTAPLTPWQWLLLLICPPLVLGAEELRKAIFLRAT